MFSKVLNKILSFILLNEAIKHQSLTLLNLCFFFKWHFIFFHFTNSVKMWSFFPVEICFSYKCIFFSLSRKAFLITLINTFVNILGRLLLLNEILRRYYKKIFKRIIHLKYHQIILILVILEKFSKFMKVIFFFRNHKLMYIYL